MNPHIIWNRCKPLRTTKRQEQRVFIFSSSFKATNNFKWFVYHVLLSESGTNYNFKTKYAHYLWDSLLYLSVGLSICLSVSQSVHLTVSQTGRKTGRQTGSQSICLSLVVRQAGRQADRQTGSQSDSLSVSQSVCLSVCQFVCQSVHIKYFLSYLLGEKANLFTALSWGQ